MVEEVVEEAILLPVEMTVLRQIIPQEKVIGPVKSNDNICVCKLES